LKALSSEEQISAAESLKELCYQQWSSEPIIAQKAARVLAILAKENPSKKVSALSLWVEGISAITKGEFEESIVNLTASSKEFESIDDRPSFGQTLVARLIPLGLTGAYDTARSIGYSAVEIVEGIGDDLACG